MCSNEQGEFTDHTIGEGYRPYSLCYWLIEPESLQDGTSPLRIVLLIDEDISIGNVGSDFIRVSQTLFFHKKQTSPGVVAPSLMEVLSGV